MKDRCGFITVAHRGASGLAPENTLAAMRKAVAIGVDAIEIDVRQTADGAIVLAHDATLERTAGLPHIVADITLDAVRSADVGSWFGKEFAGEPIPTLAEVLALTKGKAILTIEIKPHDITDDVVRVVEEEAADWVCLASFHDEVVRRVRTVAPHIPAGLIVGENPGVDPVWQAISLVRRVTHAGASLLSLSHPAVTPTLAREVRRRGVALWAWTVDDPERMRKLVECGVDGIISNFPNRFQELHST